jgi:hypothetical protein
VGKPLSKDNIKMNLREIDCEIRRWMEVAVFGISGVETGGSTTTELVSN